MQIKKLKSNLLKTINFIKSSFLKCGIYNLTLPESIKKIGKRAFAVC